MYSLIKKAEIKHNLTKDELVAILKDKNCFDFLCESADRVRQKYVGNAVHLRGLIEFSNYCHNNCCYCGLRKDNKNIIRYRLDENQIYKLAQMAVNKLGLKTIVLQSGEDDWFDQDKICSIIRKIKTLDTALTLSIGEKSLEEYKEYKKAGCDRFLIRIETTDKALYDLHDPNMDWYKRAQCLTDLKTSGIEVGTGSLVGLPEQTIESMADDILFFKKIDADMVGIGPFIAHPDTPLKNAKSGTFEMAVKVMALTRLLLPDINIPATTAMESLEKNGQVKALMSGANVIMPNVTMAQYRKHYELYPNKSETNCIKDENLDALRLKLLQIGRTVAEDRGQHIRKNYINTP